MSILLESIVIASAVFVAMLLALEFGRRFALRRKAKYPDSESTGTGVVEGSIFALLGLLVAFAFSGAASRFDGRRRLVIDETNAIGTAWLRLDLLREDDQGQLRQLFRDYLDQRLDLHRGAGQQPRRQTEEDIHIYEQTQEEIWKQAIQAVDRIGTPQVTTTVLPALNAMFDVAATRTMSMTIHIPFIVVVLLCALAVLASALAGYAMAGSGPRQWMHILAFAVVTALVLFVILDLEYPRAGIIRLDESDFPLIRLRQSMGQ